MKKEQTLSISPGQQIFYYEAGDPLNPPIILVHGLGDEADTWRHLVEPLAKQYHVIAPDLPGFGRSSSPESYSLTAYTETLFALMDAMEIQSAILVGHSLGAMIVQHAALQHPERVTCLGLISGSLLVGRQKISLQQMLWLIPGAGEWLYNRLRRDPQAAYRSLRPYYHDLDALPQADREFLYKRVNERVHSDKQRNAYLSALRSMAMSISGIQKTLPVRLSTLQIPVRIVWGVEDGLNSVDQGRRLVELLPNAILTVVQGAGHNVHQEAPEAVIEGLVGA